MGKQGSLKKRGVHESVNFEFLRKAMEWVIDPSIFQDLKTHGNIKWIAKDLVGAGSAVGLVREVATDGRLRGSSHLVGAFFWTRCRGQLPRIDRSLGELCSAIGSVALVSVASAHGAGR